MEEVRETLWKWAIQINALVGMGATCFLVLGSIHVLWSERNAVDSDKGVAICWLLLLLAPLLGILWFKLLDLRRWAGWAVAALSGAYACLAVAQIARGASYSMEERMIVVLFVYHALFLCCALLFKPKLWRGGF